VVAGSEQALDVYFTGLPTTAASDITMVTVSGDSSAGNFVLGQVHSGVDPGFLRLDFSLGADIDASNLREDLFSLQVDVSGLSDAGALAASVAPGAQRLMASQVGTWRQRMGMRGAQSEKRFGLWARLFRAKGDIAPEYRADNFGQGGSPGFEQSDSGVEAGLDFALNDQLSLGLLLATADARQRLASPGSGDSRIDGDSLGAYATWVSPAGFYLDASYRVMDFSARFGPVRADGKASSFNLEAGYAWTLSSGAKLEPQLQLTHTRVDDIDAMSLGATTLNVADGQSTTGRLGLLLSRQFAQSAGGWTATPYAVLSAVREFDGEHGFSINGDFSASTRSDGTSALVEAGLSAQRGALSLSGGLNWQDGGALQGYLGGQLNVAYRW
jgi:outer membrane autotransporter protein